ncbi:methyl-accepting chemotaxis protein [Maridesulfovibrio sp. FT414]|uniref:methyl-accepting chemotaxis protein n=1 Tax=Maridesulfovibrio sp. FT414 TaxID=2979469 RepID=UPI003D804861
MLKNFSVTTKIAGGLGIVLILLAAMAGQGIVKLNESSEGFASYRELARETNLDERIQSNLLLTRIGAIAYTTSGTEDALQQYKERFAKLMEYTEQAEQGISDPDRKSILTQIHEEISAYNSSFNKFISYKQIEHECLSGAQKNGEIIVAGLQTLLESSTEREDSFMMAMVQKSMAALYKARLANAMFILKTKQKADAEKAIAEFGHFQKTLEEIQNVLYSPADLGLINELRENNEQYLANTRRIIEATVGQADEKKKLDTIGPEIARLVEEMTAVVREHQDNLGPRMQASIKTASTTMTVSSAVTMVLGILMAFFISRSITVPLKKANAFVRDLAAGKLDSHMDVDQRDEVGMICKDMALVGETIKNAMAEIDSAISDIEVGRIDSKADSSSFSGSYADLIDRTNLATGVLRSFIEEVPMPIMTMDKNMNILFMNKSGTVLLGKSLDELKRGKCSSYIESGDCGTKNCACAKAMDSARTEHGTTYVKRPGGNLEVSYTGVPIKKDGRVVGAMEILIDQTEIHTAQRRMQDVAERTQSISEQLSSASEELSAQVEQISRGSELQRERIVETATAMDQMNSTIMEVASNASSAAGKSNEAKAEAQQGAGIVAESITAITGVQSVAEDLRDNMRSLEEQTKSISTVMNVITDIADQTNLLALNAAIEAARAGEAGRGFAVVADEVRKLAEKTMSATHEVGESIRNIQNSVRANMLEVENAVSAVEETTDLARRSGESLKTIVSTVDFSAHQVESIATASEEQSAASEQINRAISEINSVARETDEGIQQSAQAIQELAVMSGELRKLIGELRSK